MTKRFRSTADLYLPYCLTLVLGNEEEQKLEASDVLSSVLPVCSVSLNAGNCEQGSNFLINLFTLFIYFWLCWVFVAACGLSLVAVSRGYSSLRCVGFSLRWLLLLCSTGSRCTGVSSCGSQALERRLSSCDAWV